MSDEDEPAPSPSATVVARRASREAKSMRKVVGESQKCEKVPKSAKWNAVFFRQQHEQRRGRASAKTLVSTRRRVWLTCHVSGPPLV